MPYGHTSPQVTRPGHILAPDKTQIGRLPTRARGGALDISGIAAALVAVSRIAHSYPDVLAAGITP